MARKTPAIAYYRTSSAANVGQDKDSLPRQRASVIAYAKRAGLEIVSEVYDAAVKGADAIEARAGFAELLAHAEEHGIRTVVVEAASRFARDLMVQELGLGLLRAKGVELVAADDPDAFTASTPTGDLVRHLLGAVAQFEKSSLVAKLAGARDRKSTAIGRRVEGRRGYAELDPVLVREARRLRRASPHDGKRRSYAAVAAELFALGYATRNGTPLNASQVRRMLNQTPRPPKTGAGTQQQEASA